MKNIPFYRPSYGPEEAQAVAKCVQRQLVGRGPQTAVFEKEFARYLGASHAIAVNSCTAALHLALDACGIGPGDEVITTPLTFCATVLAILYLGAKPVFCDIEPDTLCLDPSRLPALITARTKAVLPVHYGGRPCNLSRLWEICRNHNLFLIEDAAHALPANWQDHRIGADRPEVKGAVCFSFQATKNLPVGDGGMVTTRDPELAELIRQKSFFGMKRNTERQTRKIDEALKFDIHSLGYKYNMTDIEAALGRTQLKKLADLQQRRGEKVRHYFRRLAEIPGIGLPAEDEGSESAWHLYVIRVREEVSGAGCRDRLMEHLADHNVQTSVHYKPIYAHDYFQSLNLGQEAALPVCSRLSREILSLPIYPALELEEIDYIAGCIRDFVAKKK